MQVIPVGKVFIKQRIDLLSAKAWLEESEETKKEVVDLSCDESMPSPYTMMVQAYIYIYIYIYTSLLSVCVDPRRPVTWSFMR